MRALARRAAGAVGYRYEARPQRLEPPDRIPQRLLQLLRLGREELERDIDVAVADQSAAALWARVGHLGRTLQLALLRTVRGHRGVLRTARQPHRDREVGRPVMIGDELARLHQLEPAIGQPLPHLLGREAQALVRKLLAQELELVGSKIDDEPACL